MTKLYAIVSEQGTACYEACLCEHATRNPERRADVEKKAAPISDVPNPTDWQDATGNDALTCIVWLPEAACMGAHRGYGGVRIFRLA